VSRPRSKLTSQGLISVPAEIRRKLGISPGSVLEWQEEGDHVVVRRVGHFSFRDIHQALFARTPNTKTLGELKAAIRSHARKKHARS
jgi:AbrB family looped-hinge helix DNA binding protein